MISRDLINPYECRKTHAREQELRNGLHAVMMPRRVSASDSFCDSVLRQVVLPFEGVWLNGVYAVAREGRGLCVLRDYGLPC